MKIIFLTFFIYCIVVHNLFASQLMQCKTEKQSGLNFIGKDHKQILSFLGLDNFSIKLSRTRDKIIQNQTYLDNLNTSQSKLKNVHFLEILILKSNGYPQVFHCSWRFNLKLNKINENPFECIEQKDKKDLFSLDFFGNFSLSSRFDALNMKEKFKKNSTLHSIFGKCEIKKEE